MQSDMQVPGRFIGDPWGFSSSARANADSIESTLRDLALQPSANTARRYPSSNLAATARYFKTLNTESPTGPSKLGMRTCPMGFDALMVSPDGKYHMCHKTDGSLPLGDCERGYDLERITEAYLLFHRALNRNECKSCWAIRLFCKLCAAPSLRDGAFKPPSDDECNCVRESVEQNFRILQLQGEYPDVVDQLCDRESEQDGIVTIDSL